MKKKSVYFVLLSLFVGACTQEDIEPSFHEDLNISSKETITSGISPDITNLESSDAEIVANRFINNNVESRSESRCIKVVLRMLSRFQMQKESLSCMQLTSTKDMF